MGTGTIEKKFDKLPDNLKLKVEGYIDALLEENNRILREHQSGAEVKIKSGFGGAKGIITYMADDFDEPLEDFKDYM